MARGNSSDLKTYHNQLTRGQDQTALMSSFGSKHDQSLKDYNIDTLSIERKPLYSRGVTRPVLLKRSNNKMREVFKRGLGF